MAESERHPFGAWLESRAGGDWLQAERRAMALLAAGLVGGHAVQFGLSDHMLVDQVSAVSFHILCLGTNEQFDGGCRGLSAALPLQSDSVKVAVSHHAHEAISQPEALIAETARILVGGGVGIFCGLGRGPRESSRVMVNGLNRSTPRQTHRHLVKAGLEPLACRWVVTGDDRSASIMHWFDRRLNAPYWLGSWSEGFVIAARKPDNASMIVKLRSSNSRMVEGAVSGSPAGGG